MPGALGWCRRRVKAAGGGGRSGGGSDGRVGRRGRVGAVRGWTYCRRVGPPPRGSGEEGEAQGRAEAGGGRVGVGGWRPGGRARSRGSFESPWAGRAGESAR